MAKYQIAWLPGDGVGKDVMHCARRVLDALKLDAEYLPGDIGWEFWIKEGNPLPERTKTLLKKTDCALFGAITSKPKEEAQKELTPELQGKNFQYYSPIVHLRQEFDLSTNLRPCKAYEGNLLNYRDDIDLVIFRENTEGLYSGIEFYPLPKEVYDVLAKCHPKMKNFGPFGLNNIAVSIRVMTRQRCENIVRQAFDYAKEHGRKSVTVVDKPNVLRETGGLMITVARQIARDYPDVEYRETNIDAQCMWLVKNPQDYDILVAENMFGDILSDLAAQLVGGLGFACSGNIGDNTAVFEPTHGSAPKYAGQYKVNPIAMILAVKLMLDWLGEKEKGNILENAVAEVIKEGRVKTYDMGGNNSSSEMTQAITQKLT